MSVVSNNILAGASGQGGAGDYAIERSLRFNAGDTAYLSKTFSSDGNRRTNTISFWIKKVKNDASGAFYRIFGSQQASHIYLYEDKIFWDISTTNNTSAAGYRWTNRLFRDPSAWYHIVCALDTTQSTASNRMRLYVNGVEETSFQATTNMGQNDQTGFSQGGIEHTFGYRSSNQGSAGGALNAYLADVHFIDGQALAPTDFGETDDNGVWQPKEFAGTYGTNGFHLDFKDNSSNAALGTDTSGNSNTWTVNNISASAPGLATANQGFDVVTYTGNGGTQSITGLNFQPDFVWLKGRSQSNVSHQLYDVVRGTSKMLQSDNNGAEGTVSGVSAFNSNGFTLGNNGGGNNSGSTYVAWAWKAGGAASSNTDGTITSSVSANNTYGFSVVTYTGTGSAATVGHGLNTVPSMYIIKNRTNSYEWGVYHTSIGTGAAQNLNYANNNSVSSTWWNNTAPTSSVFSIGTYAAVSQNNSNFVAYVWSEIAGFSKFGTFTHTGGNQTLDFGFTPRYWLVKESDGTTPWYIFDAERDNFDDPLFANTDGTASSGWGFTFSGTTVSWVSGSFLSGTYIYAAFAAKPDGSVIDSLVDTPTNAATPTDTGVGNEVVGNYCTLNPIDNGTGKTYSDGNLKVTDGGSGANSSYGTLAVSSGKWYWEIESGGVQGEQIGFADANASSGRSGNGANGWVYEQAGRKVNNNSYTSYGTSYADGDIIGIALDIDAGSATFYKNGVSQGVAFTGLSGKTLQPLIERASGYGMAWTCNFGQRAFAYPLSGYKALNTANLPEPTIADGSKHFGAVTWDGNNTDNRVITGLNFDPSMVWIKQYSSSGQDSPITDIVRGVNKPLMTNVGYAESNNDYGAVGNFGTNAFTIKHGPHATYGKYQVNLTGQSYVGWAWNGGTSTVTNNDGTIASQVRASAASGFSIVTWTGNGLSNASVGHSLNAAPSIVIIKNRSSVTSFHTYVRALDSTGRYQLYLDGSQTATDFGTPFFNADNTKINLVGGSSAGINASGNFVAWCFAPVEGYSAMGSYSGNGSADGTFVYTGFRPAWVMVKSSTEAAHWDIIDATRSPHNLQSNVLRADSNSGQFSDLSAQYGIAWDALSNGFKLRRGSATHDVNESNQSYIYVAFAEHPFKTARAR